MKRRRRRKQTVEDAARKIVEIFSERERVIVGDIRMINPFSADSIWNRNKRPPWSWSLPGERRR